MFKDLEELKEEIRQGKSNEQIINERLQYLNSQEYRESRKKSVRKDGTMQIAFYDGFIPDDEVVGITGGRISDFAYFCDEKNIYNSLIDLIRENMDKNGYNFAFLCETVRGYFNKKVDSDYNDVLEYLEQFQTEKRPYFIRETLPYIIYDYTNSHFEGSLIDFAKGFMCHEYHSIRNSEPNGEELTERYLQSLNENIEEVQELCVLPISSIKGLNFAACTEYSMLTQNCLAFLGYETYLMGGTITKGEKTEGHNFNVIKVKNRETYSIVDEAQMVAFKDIPIRDINHFSSAKIIKSLDGQELVYTVFPEVKKSLNDKLSDVEH